MGIKLKSNISNVLAVAAVVAIIAVGIGTGLFAGYFMTNAPIEHSQGNVNTGPANAAPYSVVMVITTNNIYNSTVGAQPAFFLLNNGTLESTSNISLPANRQIDLTIINYDDGNGSVASIYANVTGTLNGKETIYNNTNINSTNGGSQIAVNGSQQVASVNPNIIAHTFTVFNGSKEVLNIPIVESSVIQTSFTLASGTYSWQCEVACGTGSSGWEGAMNTNGWMAGTVSVH